MPWTQITFQVDAKHALALSELLTDAGSVAVTLRDGLAQGVEEPLYEPPPGETPLWQATQVSALFDADSDAKAIIAGLRAELGAGVILQVDVEALANQDWERVCLDSFQPMRFGDRLWVCPSWHVPPEPDAVNLLLDPGLAFGTGTHATTALCLEWLSSAALDGLTVIDYGCGSGILAVAAQRLGARCVIAVDNDPQALLATHDNAVKNGIATAVFDDPVDSPVICEPGMTICAAGCAIPVQADLLLANILAGPLIELAACFASLLRAGGQIVLSGILSTQAGAVTIAYREGFIMRNPVEREGWVRLEGRRKVS